MTPHPSVLPPEPPKLSDPEDELARVKVNFINAAYAASPLRTVERHPLLSVTATASATLAVTVIVGSFFSRAGGGLLAGGLGLASTLLRSNLLGPAISSFVSTKMAQPDEPATTTS